MGFSLGEAVLGTGVDLLGLRQGLAKAESESQTALGGIAGVFKAGLTGVVGAVAAGALAVAGTVAAVGGAAWQVGQIMDGAFDTITVATGATGEQLESLKGSFREVFTSVPTDAGSAATAIGELNKRLGYTGETLESVAAPMLEMTRLLGGDVKTNASLFARVVGDWSVKNDEAALTLDKVFKASQLTGVGVESLMGKVVQFGSPLRLMGFTLDDSIALFAKWEKEGVNAELVMGSLRIAAGKFADSGKPLRESLLATFESIQNNKDASAALAEAMDVFGARAGPDMAAAIREGRFAIDDLLTAMGDSQGAIMGAAAETADFGEKLEILKNKAIVALEPLGLKMLDVANAIVNAATPAIESLLPVVSAVAGALAGFIEIASTGGIAAAFDSLGDVPWEDIFGPEIGEMIYTTIGAISQFAAQAEQWITGVAIPAFLQAVAWVQTNWPTIQATIAGVWAGLQPILQALVDAWVTNVLPIFQTVVNWVVANWPLIQTTIAGVMTFVAGIVQQVLSGIQAWWAEHGASVMALVSTYYAFIQSIVETALNVLQGIIQAVLPAIQAFWDTWGGDIQAIVSTLFDTVGEIFDAFSAAFRGDWESFGSNLREAWDNIWKGIKEIVGRAVDWFSTQDWGAIGSGIIDGIRIGIETAATALGRAAVAAAQAAIAAVKGFLGMNSPSTVGIDIGQNLGESQALGLLSSIPEIRSAAENVAATAVDASRSLVQNFQLSVNSQQSVGTITADFALMQAMAAVQA